MSRVTRVTHACVSFDVLSSCLLFACVSFHFSFLRKKTKRNEKLEKKKREIKKNRKKKKTKIKKIKERKKKKKRGFWGVLSETSQKRFFFFEKKKVTRNRAAIEGQKNFEHPKPWTLKVAIRPSGVLNVLRCNSKKYFINSDFPSHLMTFHSFKQTWISSCRFVSFLYFIFLSLNWINCQPNRLPFNVLSRKKLNVIW